LEIQRRDFTYCRKRRLHLDTKELKGRRFVGTQKSQIALFLAICAGLPGPSLHKIVLYSLLRGRDGYTYHKNIRLYPKIERKNTGTNQKSIQQVGNNVD